MGGTEIALLGFVILFVLLFIRMPVGLAMMLVGTAGIYLIRPQAALPALGGEIFSEATDYPLTIIPLFVIMGNLAGISGMSRDLYDAAHSWLRQPSLVARGFRLCPVLLWPQRSQWDVFHYLK